MRYANPRCNYCGSRMAWSMRVKEWRCDCSEFLIADTFEYNLQRQNEN